MIYLIITSINLNWFLSNISNKSILKKSYRIHALIFPFFNLFQADDLHYLLKAEHSVSLIKVSTLLQLYCDDNFSVFMKFILELRMISNFLSNFTEDLKLAFFGFQLKTLDLFYLPFWFLTDRQWCLAVQKIFEVVWLGAVRFLNVSFKRKDLEKLHILIQSNKILSDDNNYRLIK